MSLKIINNLNLLLANPRGFCAGVERAISIVQKSLDLYGAPIYVNHEIVHNSHVIKDLSNKGVIFVDDLSIVPEGSILILSAHGVSKKVRELASRKFIIIDATCPLVSKVHSEVSRMSNDNREVIVIGHKGHPEVDGTLGQSSKGIYLVETVDDVLNLKVIDPNNLGYVTQTTLSIEDVRIIEMELKNKFPLIVSPKKSDICYATQNRQNAVKELVATCDLILVVGSSNSSNSNRLKEIAEKKGIESYLIDSEYDIDPLWFKDKKNVGITSGASAPEIVVSNVVNKIKQLGVISVRSMKGVDENIFFSMPKILANG